jgi:hypothetical protein
VGPINYGGELSLALDKELVKDRIFAAFNAVYDPEVSRAPGARVRVHAGVLGRDDHANLARRLRGRRSPLHAKIRRRRPRYPLGPGLLCRPFGVSKRFAISGAWSVQVAGRATDVPATLDLVKFTRQQALLRVEYNFRVVFSGADSARSLAVWNFCSITEFPIRFGIKSYLTKMLSPPKQR